MLVIIDYVTRFPEAVLLKSATASKIADELLKWVTWVGITKEIITDQGNSFMAGVMHKVCNTLQIKHFHTSRYPQTDGLVKRFNWTMKAML